MFNPLSVFTLAAATLIIGVSQAEACPRCGNPNCLGNGVYIQSTPTYQPPVYQQPTYQQPT